MAPSPLCLSFIGFILGVPLWVGLSAHTAQALATGRYPLLPLTLKFRDLKSEIEHPKRRSPLERL